MPSRWNLPSVLLADAISRSPCRTWISTDGWLSEAVEKIWLLEVGMVVLRSISLVITPPRVSMPSDSGVTSSRSTSLTSPFSTPAWIAAPTATTSSGLTPRCGSLPLVSRFTSSWMAGIRVAPPTRMTSSRSPGPSSASLRALLNGWTHLSVRSAVSCSNLARVIFMSRCLGPFWSAVMKGRLTSVSGRLESSILAFSAASVSRCSACRSLRRSMPCSRLNSSAR